MSKFLNTNNAQTTLAGSISNTAVTANLAVGTGVLFPNPGAGQYFVGTFTDAATGLLHEIVWVTARTGDTITMVRAQEGTTGIGWTANDLFEQLWTAGQAQALLQTGDAQSQSSNYATDTGSANAYSCTLSPAIAAPVAGMPIRVKIANSNTTASTFDPGSGASSIRRRDGSALIGGEIAAGDIVEFIWDGTYYRVPAIAPTTAAALAAGTDTQSGITPAQLASSLTVAAPPGVVSPYAGSSAPTGWLLCYGQSVATATYSALFAAIGYAYGGAGANFTIPDMRGRLAAGRDDMGGSAASRLTATTMAPNGTTVGATGGAQTVTPSVATMGGASITQSAQVPSSAVATAHPDHTHAVTMTVDGNVQPTMILNYIIKT